jgi:hypothetical protein
MESVWIAGGTWCSGAWWADEPQCARYGFSAAVVATRLAGAMARGIAVVGLGLAANAALH